MATPPPQLQGKRVWLIRLLVAVFLGGLLAAAIVLVGAFAWPTRLKAPPAFPIGGSSADTPKHPRPPVTAGQLTLFWDHLPVGALPRTETAREESNIHPSDYIGPNACKQCHARNYNAWANHPHRWMNALADPSTVKGDFSGSATISYRGGQAAFYRQTDGYFMSLERAGVRRTYAVSQTIGSRFYQYYVGKEVEGPEPSDHHFYSKDHVLPFGYWLAQKEWVPIVHIGPELPDAQRPDPFTPADHGQYYAEYAVGCNSCHTTFPLGDLFARKPLQVGEHAPARLFWSIRKYLEQVHPEVLDAMSEVDGRGEGRGQMDDWEASKHAVTLGVSCEACHLGARAHAESGGVEPPKFFPTSTYLHVDAKGGHVDFGRSHDNVNWACGRCHTGSRPKFAAGMSTWNSVEYSDAMRGSCYSQLRCVDCHNPHQALGPQWTRSPEEDDRSCLKCHDRFEPADQRLRHTHHPAGSEGARCLNCHMPRINEGLQDVVRTHMIYSPTRADMIEANHPNACNLCHTDQPIDWTLDRLKEWYGATYDEMKITARYPDRTRPVALGWVDSDNPAVRLVAVEALIRAGDVKALPRLLDAFDDPYLVNRQFAYKGLKGMLDKGLADSGYRFWMTSEERRKPLAALRKQYALAAESKGP